MKNYYLILFFIGLLSCQNRNVVKQPLAKDLIVQSLEAMDISENMASVSTQNDEIFFMVSYVNEIDSHYNIINEQIFKELLFDSLHHIYQWKDKIALNEIDYIVFSLVELDDYNSHKKVEKLLKAKINKGVFLQEVNHSEMDSLLSYDDFLGMKYLKREEILQHKKIEVRISGRHLLDKYDYSVNIIGY